jgi:hypothetical protein
MYIALICLEEILPWYVMKLSEMLTKIVMIFIEMLTYDCHGCLILRDSLPYMSWHSVRCSPRLSWISVRCAPWLSWYSVKCSPRLLWCSVRSLHMIAMIATVLGELLTHDCLELLAEYPASLWLFHTPSFHQSAAEKSTKKIVYINI